MRGLSISLSWYCCHGDLAVGILGYFYPEDLHMRLHSVRFGKQHKQQALQAPAVPGSPGLMLFHCTLAGGSLAGVGMDRQVKLLRFWDGMQVSLVTTQVNIAQGKQPVMAWSPVGMRWLAVAYQGSGGQGDISLNVVDSRCAQTAFAATVMTGASWDWLHPLSVVWSSCGNAIAVRTEAGNLDPVTREGLDRWQQHVYLFEPVPG